eukprot:CAMPEP_0174231576 /NCGR_PEP_ID=MMETSP0417-20130205/2082_1 /TAXON_ID=242541 /ORGANISM="Mayorella sp, Strain BSH-02190019" /LENGTH=105 /DNA_ID=CAMNT_0015309487 /DNA_START=85 /DNA_END=402 /DNA_ORIENTATION=+
MLTIYVKTLTGSLFALEVERSCTVLNVKEMLTERFGLPAPHLQRLVWSSREMEDQLTLVDYHFQRKSAAIVVIIRPGGELTKTVRDASSSSSSSTSSASASLPSV